jgi:hypothetical protein
MTIRGGRTGGEDEGLTIQTAAPATIAPIRKAITTRFTSFHLLHMKRTAKYLRFPWRVPLQW